MAGRHTVLVTVSDLPRGDRGAAIEYCRHLEQTFIVPKSALVLPEIAPVRVLERLCGVPLTTES